MHVSYLIQYGFHRRYDETEFNPGSLAPKWSRSSRLDSQRGPLLLEPMNRDERLKRLRFRAWHRGTREADLLIGGFFDRHHSGWREAEMAWFEALLEEQDVDIMAWAIGTAEPPERFVGEMMLRLKNLNYIKNFE